VKPGIPALFVFAFAAAQPSNDIVFISNETGEVSYLPGEPTRAAYGCSTWRKSGRVTGIKQCQAEEPAIGCFAQIKQGKVATTFLCTD